MPHTLVVSWSPLSLSLSLSFSLCPPLCSLPRSDRTVVQRGGGCGVAYVCKSLRTLEGVALCSRVNMHVRGLTVRACVSVRHPSCPMRMCIV